MLKACIVQNSEDDVSEHDAHCRQRFENHDDVQLVRFLDIFVVFTSSIVVVVVVILSSSLVVSIVSIVSI